MDSIQKNDRITGTPITRRIVEFVEAATFEKLPTAVVQRAKNSFLDTLGIGLGGASEAAPRILADFARQTGGTGSSTVLAQGFRTSAPLAAMVNGTAADIVGWSDISVVQMTHPSVSICPAVWALGEQLRSPGKDVILAHVLGVEVADKIGAGVKPGLQLKGWHPLAVLNTFGCAAAGAKLLGLDAGRMGHAMGIAGAEAGGMRVAMGSMSKAYGAGRSARDGLTAALLAQLGYTGPRDVIEGRDGFLQTFGDGASGAGILDNFGAPYEFESPGITLKKFPACTRSHNGIQGMINLRKAIGFKADDVESVTCLVTPAVVDYLKFSRPRTKFEAKYSMEFCLATIIRDGSMVVGSFSDELANDPMLNALMDKITMTICPEYAKDGYNPSYAPYGCIVNLRLKDGREFSERVDRGPWEPDSSPSWDDLAEKFRGNAELVLDSSAVDRIIETIGRLEDIDDFSEVMALVYGEP